ncbi:MAG: hypothetical protein HQL43_15390 [Alphaproteobacteria bacterium]|jgi:hypothetical protein|nr:hypothetical protein [Alphaproteobacteria bacterium]
MAAVSLTLFREKTVIVARSQGQEEVLATVKSNRILLPLGSKLRRESIVVRGRNLPDTLRLSGLIIAEARRSSSLLDRDVPLDWKRLWHSATLLHGTKPDSDSWGAVFGNGAALHLPAPCPHIEVLERHAAGNGGYIDEVVLKSSAAELGGSTTDVKILHASKAAVVATLDENGYRCAVQMRTKGNESAFSFAIPVKEKGVNFGTVLELAAHYVEGHNTTVFLEKVRGLVESRQVATSKITPRDIETAIERKRALKRLIVNFEQDATVRYRPDRPNFLVA